MRLFKITWDGDEHLVLAVNPGNAIYILNGNSVLDEENEGDVIRVEEILMDKEIILVDEGDLIV